MAFVTSRGIADTQGNQFVRDYLVHRCNLITALRLPDSLFMQTSGIEVGSDLLIFQKSGRKVTLTDREKLFMETTREMRRMIIPLVMETVKQSIARLMARSHISKVVIG